MCKCLQPKKRVQAGPRPLRASPVVRPSVTPVVRTSVTPVVRTLWSLWRRERNSESE